MDTQKKLSSKGMCSDERVNLLSEAIPPTLDGALSATPLAIPERTILNAQHIPGLFFAEEIFDPPDRECFLDAVNKSPGNWDTSLKRHRKDFGFVRNGKITGSPSQCLMHANHSPNNC